MRSPQWVLAAGLLGACAALLLLSGGSGRLAPAGQELGAEALAEDAQDTAQLEGHTPSSPVTGGAGGSDGDHRGPTERAAPSPETPKPVTFTLRTADGDPAPLSRVVIIAIGPNGSRSVTLADVTPEGTATAELILPLVHMLKVLPHKPGQAGEQPVLMTWQPGQGSLEALPPIVVKHAHVRVRTVDSRGDPRPDQRVLFRRREVGQPGPGRYGQRSDEQGWLELGPFPIGARIELRPGWRGHREKSLSAITDKWTPVVAGSAATTLFVGDQPRLVLAFTDRGDDKLLPITVIEADTGRRAFPTVSVQVSEEAEQTWRAPALKEGKPYEVVVGPTQAGLFARVKLEGVPYQDVPITLTPATHVAGRVLGVPAWDVLGGEVHATGRGFRVKAQVGDDGRFEFPGLPTNESVHLAVTAETKGPGDIRMRVSSAYGWAGETWLNLQLDQPAPMTIDPVYKLPKNLRPAVSGR